MVEFWESRRFGRRIARRENHKLGRWSTCAIYSEMACNGAGRNDLQNISKRVGPRVSMDAEACYEYLRGIEHDLSPEKKKGLVRFIEYLIQRGEGVPAALPLKIFS